MTEPILDPNYWRERAERAARIGEDHRAVYETTLRDWQLIEARHREILLRTIHPNHSVLDCGCGWGRLLDLMPANWHGAYLGVDLSPDFIRHAKYCHPEREFLQWDLRELDNLPSGLKFDWAILVSVRPMVRNNLGEEQWQLMEAALRKRCAKLLYLEYDHMDEGSVE